MHSRTPFTSVYTPVLLVMVSLSACGGGDPGAPLGQDGAHEHGVADLSLVVDGTEVSVLFQAPAGDILGYEGGEPGEEELAAAREALRGLESNLVAMLGIPEQLECRVVGVSWEGAAHEVLEATGAEGDVDEEGSEGDQAADDHEGEDHEDHGEEDEGGHSDLIADFTITCGAPLEGSSLVLAISDYLEGIEEVDLQAISEGNQVGRRVSASGTEVDL